METKNLSDARKDMGWSQKDLAEITNLTQTTISQLEAGKGYPRHSTRVALQNALGCNLKFDLQTKNKKK